MGMTRRHGDNSQENQSLIANKEENEVAVAGLSGEKVSSFSEQL